MLFRPPPRAALQGRVIGILIGQTQVLPNRAADQPHVLEDESDGAIQLFGRVVTNIATPDGDSARVYVVEARHQFAERRFARAARADQRGDGARSQFEIEIAQHLVVAAVAEADTLEPDHTRLVADSRRGAAPGHQLGCLLQFVQAQRRRARGAQRLAAVAEAEQGTT